jgi:transcriptional regulator with XRE-family HTH domain
MDLFIYEQIIEKIKLEREFLKIYEYELANILKISERTYRRKEKGDSPFLLQEFLIICEKTKRSPSYYIMHKEDENFSNHNSLHVNSLNKLNDVESLKLIVDALLEKINKLQIDINSDKHNL